MFKQFKYIFLVIFIATATVAQAQRDTLTQEVEVTKAYKPTISDANKLNSMPTIDETEHQKPTFNYQINSTPVFSTFSVNPLKAATIETKKGAGSKGYGLVRAGLGNYYKPYGEVFFNNVNSKNSTFGIHAKHLSSFGNIKLEGGDKVDAPFMKNEVDLFVKYMFRNSVLSVNLDYKNDGFNYYGYPLDPVPEFLLEDNQNINYFGTKQAFNKGGFNISLKNPTAEMDDATFGFNFDYHYFGTKTNQREHFAKFSFDVQQPFQIGVGLLEAGIQYNNASEIIPRGDSIVDTKNLSWFYVKPSWYLGNQTANIKVGVNAWFTNGNNESTKAKITPNVKASWSPIAEILTIYAGVDGNYISNHYSKVAYENPFINPDHDVKNSFEKIRFYGGFDGKFSKKTNFKISAEYSIIDDQPFYYLNESYYLDPAYNPAPLVVDNTFATLYDNMNRLKLNAEVFHASSDKLDLLASVNYYNYKLDEQTEAWNMPTWDANFSINYKVNERLSLSTDIFMIGQRKALIVEDPGVSRMIPLYKSNNLDATFDLNAKGNYQVTSKFSVFAQLNNFGFQKYQRWLGYPVQSFNFLAGVSYAF
uniref:hypothetical protein n=1 Tax=uncultured Draconibacterium sp. TaxID=1573823 RepID=UPI0032167B85